MTLHQDRGESVSQYTAFASFCCGGSPTETDRTANEQLRTTRLSLAGRVGLDRLLGHLELGTRQRLFLVEMFEPPHRTVDVGILGM